MSEEAIRWIVGGAVVAAALLVPFITHVLTARRDRAAQRLRSWDDAANQLRAALQRQREAVGPGPHSIHFDAALQAAPARLEARLRLEVAAYREARSQNHQDAAGQPLFDDPAAVTAAIDRLLALLS